jgi:hypothetical protein
MTREDIIQKDYLENFHNDYAFQFKKIKKRPYYIKYLRNVREDIQKYVTRRHPKLISFIVNPAKSLKNRFKNNENFVLKSFKDCNNDNIEMIYLKEYLHDYNNAEYHLKNNSYFDYLDELIMFCDIAKYPEIYAKYYFLKR